MKTRSMDDRRSTRDNTRKKPVVIPPAKTVQNPNPKTNENIRVRTEEPKTQKTEPLHDVGREITDGEDG